MMHSVRVEGVSMWPAASSAKRRRWAHYAIGLVLISGAFDAAAVETPAGAKAADVLAVASYLGAKTTPTNSSIRRSSLTSSKLV